MGAGKKTINIIGLIIGTGVGSGIIINKKLYTGQGYAGEIGHTIIDPSGLKCSCGNIGDVESWVSGPNIVKRYNLLGGKLKNPTPKEIFKSKEKAARITIDITLEKLAVALANLINTLDPDLIILGGGLSNQPIYKELNKRIKKYTRNPQPCKIVKNKLGDAAGTLGAAFLHNL